MSASLPEEINRDILLRLPAKSLVACKCVCKSWFSIISDHDFVKIHLDRTINTNNRSIMLQGYGDSIYCISYDLLLSSSNESHDGVALKADSHYNRLERIELLGSCNGLLYFWSSNTDLYALWNPTTKECKRLPKSWQRGTIFGVYARCDGFGYDYKTNDYKLVYIEQRDSNNCSVQIYSLKSNSWKSCKSIPYDFQGDEKPGVFFNGALYWLAWTYKQHSKVILSMDMSEERFREVQLPTTHGYFENMSVLEGCLCVLAHIQESFEIWVMQDSGVRESWTKLHTIPFQSTICRRSYDFMKLAGSLMNGEILFKDSFNDKLFLYDPKCGTTRKLNISGINIRVVSVNYIESLVSLNSNTAV